MDSFPAQAAWLYFSAGSSHSSPHLFPGEITHPIIPPAMVSAYREGGTYSILIESQTQNILVHGSTGFYPGFLANRSAQTVFLSVASLSRANPHFIEQYFCETILAVKAKQVFPIHWDDFQQPAGDELKYPPAWIDDIPQTLHRLEDFCNRHQVIYTIPPYATPLDLTS